MVGSRFLKFSLIFIGIVFLLGVILFYFFNPKRAVELVLPDFSKVNFINATIKNGDSIQSKMDIVVQNKSPYKLSIDSIYFKVSLNKEVLIEEFVPLYLIQKRYQVDTIKLPIDLSRKKLRAILARLKGNDSTNLDIHCYAIYNTFLGRIKLNYEKSIHIPVPVPPQIKVVKVERKKFNMSDKILSATIQLKIINVGKNIDLQLQHIHYSMEIGHTLSSEGDVDKLVSIKPESITALEIPVDIKVDRPLKAIVEILTDHDQTNYILHLKAEMIEHMVDKSSQTPIPVEIEATGGIELKK